METKNYDVRPLRLAASDWFDEQVKSGRLLYRMSARGNCKQFVVSPAVCQVLQRFYSCGQSPDDDYFITFQVEIKTVKGKGTATMRITCHQTEDMPEGLRAFYIDSLLPMMGRDYRKNASWYDLQLNGMKLTPFTQPEEIRHFLEIGFGRAEFFEQNLLNL